jgi:hypothetical protein
MMADQLLLPSDIAEQQPATDASPPAQEGAPSLMLPSDIEEQKTSPSVGQLGSQLPTGFNTRLAHIAGAPVDVVTGEVNKGITPSSSPVGSFVPSLPELVGRGLRAVGLADKPIEQPFAGSQSIEKGMGALGIHTDEQQPATAPERIARAAGSGAADMVLNPARGLYDVAAGMFSGATGAATGQGLSEAVPDKYKPIAQVAGNILGGGAGAVASEAPRVVASAARQAGEYVAPLTAAGRERLASQTLADSATSRAATLDALENEPRELVPGSSPTTFQVTGDMGLGALERRVATQNPEEFNTLRGDQNAARVSALDNVQPTGAPEDVSNFFRSQLQQIDTDAQLSVDDALQKARTSADQIGGLRNPEAYGQDIRDQILPKMDQISQGARQQVASLGGTGNLEEYGSTLRNALQSAKDAAKTRERSLWQAVDPDGTLALDVSPLKSAAAQIESRMTPSAKPISGEESDIFNAIRTYDPVTPFNELTDLRSRITAEMRGQLRTAGETPTYARLAQLRGAVESSINNAIERKAAQEQAAVAIGAMNPEDTMAAKLQRDIEEYRARQAAARQNAGASVGAVGSAGATGISSIPGGKGQGFGGSGIPPGTQGVSRNVPLTPNLDEDAAQRLKAATQATKERAQTFGQGPVGQTLKSQGAQGNYRLQDAAVPAKLFHPGPTGYQDVQAFRAAVGDDAAALDALQNYASASLRKAALRADGTLDPSRFATWRRAHSDALRAVPELAARFSNTAKATDALEQFAPFRADIAPSHLPEVFFHPGQSGFEGVQHLRRLTGDEHALPLLQDYAASRLRHVAMNPDGTINPAKLQTWLRAHDQAMRAFPELRAKFQDAATASQAVSDAAAARKAAVDAYQKGSAGKLLNVEDPEDVTRVVGGIFGQKNAVQQMRKLAVEAEKSPAAKEGLRKAVVDFIGGKFISNTEAGTSGQNLMKADAFQTFIKQNEGALKQIFTDEEVNSMKAIAADLKRANRTIAAVKLPGQSNTAQDLTAVRKAEPKERASLLNKMIAGGASGFALHSLPGAAIGAASAAGQHVISSLRAAGIEKVDDLVKEAMLHPDIAKALLAKAPIKPDRGSEITLAQRLKRLAVFGAAQAAAASMQPAQ